MEGQRDYYDVLGVPSDADAKALKSAFRKLALRCHPDRNKATGAQERFREIVEAYAVLSNHERRAMYDARGFAGLAGMSPEDLLGGVDLADLVDGLEVGARRPFDRIFAPHAAAPSRGPHLEVSV